VDRLKSENNEMYNELQSLKHKINTVEHANDGFKKTNSEL